MTTTEELSVGTFVFVFIEIVNSTFMFHIHAISQCTNQRNQSMHGFCTYTGLIATVFTCTCHEITYNLSWLSFHFSLPQQKWLILTNSLIIHHWMQRLRYSIGVSPISSPFYCPFQVKVEDSGKPPLSSTTYVALEVREAILHPPVVISPRNFTVVAYEGTFPGGVIGHVRALDPDNDRLTYGLVTPEYRRMFR